MLNCLHEVVGLVPEELYLVEAEVLVHHVATASCVKVRVGRRNWAMPGVLHHAGRDANGKGSKKDLQQGLDIGLGVQEMPGIPGGHGSVHLVGVEYDGARGLALEREELAMDIEGRMELPCPSASRSNYDRVPYPLEDLSEHLKEGHIPEASAGHGTAVVLAVDVREFIPIGRLVEGLLGVTIPPA